MIERWSFTLLDVNDREKATLPRVRGGSMEWSTFAQIPSKGTIQITEDAAVDIDYLNDRVRCTHYSDDVPTVIGTFVLSMTGRNVDVVSRVELQLADKCELLNNEIGEWVTVPAGAVVTDKIVDIINGRGETSVALTESSLTMPIARTWAPNMTWLQMVNDLLSLINYSSLYTDPMGNFVIAPYVPPGSRRIAGTYGAGALRMKPTWIDEASFYTLPNGARMYVPGTDTAAGFIGKADLPDAHPLSAANRGRQILLVKEVEAANLTTANGLAERELLNALQVIRRVTIEHPVDGTTIDEVVELPHLDLVGPIVNREITIGVGAVVKDTVRTIYTQGALPWD